MAEAIILIFHKSKLSLILFFTSQLPIKPYPSLIPGVEKNLEVPLITNRLLNEVKFDVVRGNISEIQFLGGLNVKGKGVDSFDDGADSSEIVIEVAKKLECVVVASGKTDLISDGNILYKIQNGSAKLKYITGTGCMSTSLIGSLLPCTDKAIEGAVIGTLAMSLSGELADKENPPIGTYKTLLYDNLFSLSKDVLEKYARIEIEQIN